MQYTLKKVIRTGSSMPIVVADPKGERKVFGFSMIQMIRHHADKLDRPLRDQLLNVYRPFRWTPCFMHERLESFFKLTKSLRWWNLKTVNAIHWG